MPKPNAHRRLELLRRRQAVADLYVQGFSQMAIAERLGISQATVSADLKQIRREWRESAIRDFDHAQDRELAKIDRLEREAWEAWERSQRPQQSAVLEGEGAQQPRRKTMRSQNGDPRYLDLVHKCIAARCALLGLNAPQRLEHSGPNGKPLAFTTLLATADKQPTDPPPLERTGNVFDVDAELARVRADHAGRNGT
jgi:predicted transcriptional regulator